MKNTIIVCEYGWIIIGKKGHCDSTITELAKASVVRSWKNGKGIGGLTKKDNKNEYTLDAIGDVFIHNGKILFEIPCEW